MGTLFDVHGMRECKGVAVRGAYFFFFFWLCVKFQVLYL